MGSQIALLGAGSWGSALALRLAWNGCQVALWGRDRAMMATLAQERCNTRYLPGVELPEQITPTADLNSALQGADALLLAVPSHAFGDTLRAVAPQLSPTLPVAWATKGLEPGSGRLLHQVAAAELSPTQPLAVISGPTFATEVAHHLPTAITIAADTPATAEWFAARLHSATFRTYTSTDLVGVQLGGAAKNVLAIAAGIADGLGLGANTRAALITRGLAELMRLGEALGAQRDTLMGLTGLGDLVLTCTDNQSRNRRAGLALGEGEPIDKVLARIGQAVEGVKACPELCRLARQYQIEMPITEQVRRVLAAEATPQQAVTALLTRELKPEC